MNGDNLPILIATDRAQAAEKLARALGEELARVHVSSDPARCVQDFELRQPAVLILLFGTLTNALRYYEKLRQPRSRVHAPPHRVLILCAQHEMREAYELCKRDYVDDIVLFEPQTEELRPLRVAVRRALRQVTEARDGAPGVSDFAARARRLVALEPLLEERVAQAAGAEAPQDELAALLGPVRALRLLAERCPPLVLVVDDDRLQHKLLSQALATEQLELSFATTVAEAFASLHKRRPDLILMDVSMPEIDGIAATRLLKSAEQFKAIAVIMITGIGGPDVVVECLKAGAADFVVKPFDRAILLGKVRKVLFGRAGAA